MIENIIENFNGTYTVFLVPHVDNKSPKEYSLQESFSSESLVDLVSNPFVCQKLFLIHPPTKMAN